MRNKNIGFVGDSLNENFLVSFLCILRVADEGAKKWKEKKGAWRELIFLNSMSLSLHHRAVLLAKYERQSKELEHDRDGLKGRYRVDVDVPAVEWTNICGFYNVLVFNTGHWWGYDKFPEETPFVFYREG
ncbi:Protein trichome birefringence-like [Quillaja saponaria]|uniref:Protein trichome birefringence-like n=1 Tax=Quillaja saponaria TaxID=32244 RepID=A0AAD7P9P3_QUISA|nr:Protein trichome birefringence-like [Quillaja saponaria]